MNMLIHVMQCSVMSHVSCFLSVEFIDDNL